MTPGTFASRRQGSSEMVN